jgi:hypothetical protein
MVGRFMMRFLLSASGTSRFREGQFLPAAVAATGECARHYKAGFRGPPWGMTPFMVR